MIGRGSNFQLFIQGLKGNMQLGSSMPDWASQLSARHFSSHIPPMLAESLYSLDMPDAGYTSRKYDSQSLRRFEGMPYESFLPTPSSAVSDGQQLEPSAPRVTLAGSLDPSTGIFYRAPEHPRLRTANACKKCRTRKAKVGFVSSLDSSRPMLTTTPVLRRSPLLHAVRHPRPHLRVREGGPDPRAK
ncbi:hypothetical protein DFH07DRAFT_812885 [Mycena maculata]|uniref:Uncharacterized protein n=1 Tax=Mycena maculata TaxID=230809 RepID=A0AAD7JEH1_9AGAR|nr:hypothetical protein DFH07DRAFT_812885 [Mycena maculata]